MTKKGPAKLGKAKAPATLAKKNVSKVSPAKSLKGKVSAKPSKPPMKVAAKIKIASKSVPAKSQGKAEAAKKPAAVVLPQKSIAAEKSQPVKKLELPKKKMVSRAKLENIVLPPDYRPSEDEPFMNDKHRAYFRKRLLEWKDEILRQTRETLAILHEDSSQHADLADRATSETDRATELRTRDRQRKLVSKIEAALNRIEDGSYGFCEDTGEPIGLKRLDARPIATLSVEAQERHERRERVYREE